MSLDCQNRSEKTTSHALEHKKHKEKINENFNTVKICQGQLVIKVWCVRSHASHSRLNAARILSSILHKPSHTSTVRISC